LITPFTACRYPYAVQRYLRSKSKVVVKRTKFCAFFALRNFKGAVPPKSCTRVITPYLAARHVAKSQETTPFGSKDPSSNTLHFKPIFDPLLKKVVRMAAVPGGGCASKTWSFFSACKNLGAQHLLGAEIRSFEKCTLGGYDSTSRSPRSLDQTSPYLFRRTLDESP